MPKVKHFSTTTAGAAPSSLLDGEVGINRADSLMFWKDSAGAIRNANIARGAPKLVLGNFPTGGVIGTAAATVDKYDAITIAQTTAGQTVLLPKPSVINDRFMFITNTGTVPVFVSGQVNPFSFYVPVAGTLMMYYSSTYDQYLKYAGGNEFFSEDYETTFVTYYNDHRIRMQAGSVTNFPTQANFAVYGADGVAYTMPARSNAGAGAGYVFNLGNGTTSGVYTVKSGTGTGSMFTLRNSANAQLMTFNNSGSMSIGSQAPTARLHILAGTATASTAPIKLTAGTNLTTPENGAIEYDGTDAFITSAGTRYKFALSDRQTEYSKPHYIATVTGTYAASYTWDINASPNLRLVLTGNITVGITGTPLDGAVYNLTLEQGGSGGYTATFSSSFVMRNDSSLAFAQNIALTLGAFTIMSFYGHSSKLAG